MSNLKQTLSGVAVKLRPWYGLIGKVVFLVVALIIIFGILFGLKRMPSIAMSPSINDGDLMMFSRSATDYNENDVVMYDRDGKTAVSRIIAKETQTVSLDGDGYITVDGAIFSKTPVTSDVERSMQEMGMPFRVPLGRVYLLNDNYDLVEDSRIFGAISTQDLRGKITTVLKVRGI